jgi:predicted RNase H-like HicB family nuclease
MLDIATQGRTEEEVKENMADLIEEYMEDPDRFYLMFEVCKLLFKPFIRIESVTKETFSISRKEYAGDAG